MVLEVIGVILAVWAVLAVVALLWLARRNRVGPGARTGAPLHWLVAPSRAAGAHRRLRRAVATARAALDGTAPGVPAHAELAVCVAALERQAVDLDHRLVVAARCPPSTRWTLVGELNPQVSDVERIAGHLAALAVLSPTEPESEGGIEALNARLTALTAARAELDALEAPALVADGPAAAPDAPRPVPNERPALGAGIGPGTAPRRPGRTRAPGAAGPDVAPLNPRAARRT